MERPVTPLTGRFLLRDCWRIVGESGARNRGKLDPPPPVCQPRSPKRSGPAIARLTGTRMTTRRHAPEPRATEDRKSRVFRIASLDQPARHLTRARLESDEPFPFFAGQFVRVGFDGLHPRDLSIASKPGERFLEFHIRDIGRQGTRQGESLFARLRAGMPAGVEGPFGCGYLREEHAGPMLLVAGGSGIAPAKSIAETALAKGMRQPIHLYFGVRDESDLYLGPHFHELARGHANFNFVPVLSHSESNHHRRGMAGWRGWSRSSGARLVFGCRRRCSRSASQRRSPRAAPGRIRGPRRESPPGRRTSRPSFTATARPVIGPATWRRSRCSRSKRLGDGRVRSRRWSRAA